MTVPECIDLMENTLAEAYETATCLTGNASSKKGTRHFEAKLKEIMGNKSNERFSEESARCKV